MLEKKYNLKPDNSKNSRYFIITSNTKYIPINSIKYLSDNSIDFKNKSIELYNILHKKNNFTKIKPLSVKFDKSYNKYIILDNASIYKNAIINNWTHIWSDIYINCDDTDNKKLDNLTRNFIRIAKNKEKHITRFLKNIVKPPNYLYGLKYKLKKYKSLRRKLDKMCIKSLTDSKINFNVYDTLRYTIILKYKNYLNDLKNIIKLLESSGYKLVVFKNLWDNNDTYSGVNLRFNDKNFQFELQVNTKASMKAKEKSHKYYEKYREKNIDNKTKCILFNKMVKKWKNVPIPKDILNTKINDLEQRYVENPPKNCKLDYIKNNTSKIKTKLKIIH
jgi:hypothetical protein